MTHTVTSPTTSPPPTILIVGATSAIATATARIWATSGARFVLVGRDMRRLETVAQDLSARGGSVLRCIDIDPSNPENAERIIAASWEQEASRWTFCLIAHGFLGPSPQDTTWQVCQDIVRINFLSVTALLLAMRPRLTAVGRGHVGVISSVAGDRGRASNYPYGASKAALSAFVSGWAAEMQPHGITTTLIRPGPVHSPMTVGMKLPFPSTPDRVGQDIARAFRDRRPDLYTPWFWRWIMAIITALPEKTFRLRRI